MKVHLTLKSGNEKTGKIPCSMTERSSCPSTCPFYNKGCYALYGPCKMHWDKVSARGLEWKKFCAEVEKFEPGQIWRHNVAGDLPGRDNKIDSAKLSALVKANHGKMGYTYSHKQLLSGKYAKDNRKQIKAANKGGLTINLSANSLAEVDKLAALKIGPVTVVLPADCKDKLKTPKGRTVIKCPAQSKEGISCENCKLCARPNRNVVIGFAAHGAATKTVSEIVGNK